jgi:Uncharacterized protein conserved in bacteria (DUF2066)
MPSGRWFSTILAALLAAGLAVHGASAQVATNNSYTVSGIDVDVTGADALKARDQAIWEAKRRGAQQLADRMVAPEDRGRVPPLDDARLDSMVRGVEFANDRSMGNHYIGSITVVFAADQVKAWLSAGGIKSAETVTRPALVIPLWKGNAGVEPLDDRNAWRDAWRTLDSTVSSVPTTIIRGDQLDQNALSAEEAFIGDTAALSRLNERYRVPTIIVAIVEGDKTSGPLTVSGIRYDTQTGVRTELPKVSVTAPDQLPDAVRRMHAKLDQDWRGVATVRRDSEDALDVVVPIRTLGDWVQIRQRLGGVPAVKRMTVRTLEAERADIRLDFYGTPEELQRTLAQAGLQLTKEADEWRLQAR